jgi:hypothetical protein
LEIQLGSPIPGLGYGSADRLEKLADRAMIFDTQLNGSSSGVRLHENDAVLAAFQFVMLLESLFVFVELGTLDEIY